ncbi:MAG: host attachment protein [Porticoccus sp.]
MTTWILVADGAHARIFSAEKSTSTLNELEGFVHSKSRQHEQKLTSDLPGRQAGGSTASHHSVGNENNIKENEAVVFAKELSRRLDAAHREDKFRRLIVVAAPAFLGHLRQEMSSKVSNVVSHELDKDIVNLDVTSIREHLPKHF